MSKITIGVLAVAFIAIVFLIFNQTDETDIESNPTPSTTQNDNKPEPVVTNTETVNLSGQGLKKVPDNLFDQTLIKKLDLSNNAFEGSLPAEVRFLKDLKELNLSNNEFSGVPAEIGQLKNLEVLDLSNNNITGLPQELGNLSNLKVLNLKGNEYSVEDLNFIKDKLGDSVEIMVD